MNITSHAKQRLQQRALNSKDLNMIIRHGTDTNDGYFLRRTDVQAIEKTLKSYIKRLKKLEGKFVVVEGNDVLTAYHPTKKKERRILRRRVH